MSQLMTMLDYDHWANKRTLAYMEEARQLDPKALELFSHIVGSQRIWMERMKGKQHVESTKDRTLEECKSLLQFNYNEYTELLSWLQMTDLTGTVEYHDMKGTPQTNTLRDIFTHVFNHGTYHRGQIALLVRAEGDVPVPTDFIVMAREKSTDF